MPDKYLHLTSKDSQRLDAIVKEMKNNGESTEFIENVIADFTSKYGKKKDGTEPSSKGYSADSQGGEFVEQAKLDPQAVASFFGQQETPQQEPSIDFEALDVERSDSWFRRNVGSVGVDLLTGVEAIGGGLMKAGDLFNTYTLSYFDPTSGETIRRLVDSGVIRQLLFLRQQVKLETFCLKTHRSDRLKTCWCLGTPQKK